MARKENDGVLHGQRWKKHQNAREDVAALAYDIEADTTAIPYVPNVPAAAARLAGDAAIKAQRLRQRLTELDGLSKELYDRTRTTSDGETSDAVYKRRKGDK